VPTWQCNTSSPFPRLTGAAIFAGGPFYCAQNNIGLTVSCMQTASLINLGLLEADARTMASAGTIDNLGNLRNHRIFLFSGTRDSIVAQPVVKKLQTMYSDFGAGSSTRYDIGDEHAFPTNGWGNSCGTYGSPYINNCGFDGAGAALSTIWDDLSSPVENRTEKLLGTMKQISQGKYTPGGLAPAFLSMGSTAYLYVPSGCSGSSSNCRLHIAFHGCLQGYGQVGDAFINNAGYNGWAESNNILVLYPQIIITGVNPQGCWDWWGYTGIGYPTRNGRQMATVTNMVNCLASGNLNC